MSFPPRQLWLAIIFIPIVFSQRQSQRQFVLRYMPEASGAWFALRSFERWTVNWAIARGASVQDPRLAALAVARAHMRQAQWEHFRGRRIVLVCGFTWVLAAAFVAWGDAHHNGWALVYGGILVLAVVSLASILR